MLTGITITCFAASYAVTLGLDISRLFFRLRVRWVVMVAFAGAGLFAHTVYLITLTRQELAADALAPLSGWYDWCLMAAWVLAAAYLGLAVKRPKTSVGLFLIPLVLALIGIATTVRHQPPFAREQALSYWGFLHGLMLLLGTVATTLGFAAGVMYLLQSYRLKQKLPPQSGFRLPSLEWLQRFNRRSLLISTCLIGIGLLAGIMLNLIRQETGEGMVSWVDPVVLSSSVLFIWLAVAMAFESFYKPARAGRKVAYMTMANFVFLGLVLVFVLSGRHGSNPTDANPHQPESLRTIDSSSSSQGLRPGGRR